MLIKYRRHKKELDIIKKIIKIIKKNIKDLINYENAANYVEYCIQYYVIKIMTDFEREQIGKKVSRMIV